MGDGGLEIQNSQVASYALLTNADSMREGKKNRKMELEAGVGGCTISNLPGLVVRLALLNELISRQE